MDPKKRPWQPRIDKEPELNPSVRTTEPAEEDERTLEDIEAESEESEARDDDPEPIKIPHRTP
jgi:hypothetical protein